MFNFSFPLDYFSLHHADVLFFSLSILENSFNLFLNSSKNLLFLFKLFKCSCSLSIRNILFLTLICSLSTYFFLLMYLLTQFQYHKYFLFFFSEDFSPSLLMFLLSCFLSSVLSVLKKCPSAFSSSIRMDRYRRVKWRITAAFFPHTCEKISSRKRNEVPTKLLLASHSLNYCSGGAGNTVKEHNWKGFNS